MAEANLETGEVGEWQVIWNGTGGQAPEGPHVYFKDNWYYLLAAEGKENFKCRLCHSLIDLYSRRDGAQSHGYDGAIQESRGPLRGKPCKPGSYKCKHDELL